MDGGIYRSEFEALKAAHIMWRRVSMEKQVDNRRSVVRVFAGKNKLLEKYFEKLVNVR